jgi:antitoxin component of RelBE/YafQ-DinJ toxin-antitoxin module
MKITVEISDSLLLEARRLAARAGVTLETVVERDLHRVISETWDAAPFKLRRASFKGKGFNPDLQDASWERLRDLAYQDHGS